MRRFVTGLFAVIGLLTVLVLVAIGGAAWWAVAHRPDLPGTIVLRADLGRGLAEGPGRDGLSDIVFGAQPTLRDFLDALDRAGDDGRVKGIYATLGADNLALATCQEVRDAIAAFRAKGKFAIAFATSFGEFGPGTRPYYLATAFDDIWLQPLGSVGLIGLHAEMPFLRGTLDKLGVEPIFSHREQYKTATNFLTETAMTPPEREQTEDLLSADSAQIIHGIAAARKRPKAEITSLIDRGPFGAEAAKSAGLIDRIGYFDEVTAQARQRAGSGAKLVTLKRYLDGAGRPHRSGTKIALIYGTGLITEGGTNDSPIGGGNEFTARRMIEAFRQAADDKDVRAILFRISSPGGSAVASETIWRAVAQAQQHGKPVIVSMGAVAGSGGYYVAAPASTIVAEPATLTGSIGVLGGKLVIAGLLNRLGATAEAAQRGANASMFSEFEDFSPDGRAHLEAFLDETYHGFKQRVASGRHFSEEQVEALAKGRVWTGAEAKDNGLVDALGGYEAALQFAREAAKVPAGQPFRLAMFPRAKSTIERLYDRMEGSDSDDESGALGAAGWATARLTPLLDAIETLTTPMPLRMPLIGEIR